MRRKSQLKRAYAFILAFVVAVGLFAVPASASTVSILNIAGNSVTSYSAVQGQEIWLRAQAPGGTSVTITGGIPHSFPGGSVIPANANYIWFVLSVPAGLPAGNHSVNVGGTTLAVNVTAMGNWNPGLVASGPYVSLGTDMQTIYIAQGETATVSLDISRGGAQVVTVTAAVVGGITASGTATIAAGAETGTINLTVPASAAVGSIHNIVFTASGTTPGVEAGTSTLRVVVAEGDTGGRLGDLNGDGFVDGGDLLIVRQNWGPVANAARPDADLNGDGFIDAGDILILRQNWG